jgi:alkylation response protein AidB-like acyl-CoA dehydrogenase
MTVSDVDVPTESIEAFTERVKAWAAENLTSLGASGDDDRFAAYMHEIGLEPSDNLARGRAVLRRMAEAGLTGLTLPKEYGGQGLPPSYLRAFNDGVTGYDVSLQQWILVLGMNAPGLLEFGTEEQKKEYLPRLLRGDDHWIQFLSEPTGGSDLASTITRADLDGDEWVINGSKIWTSLADQSDMGMCLARTNWDVPKHSGLTVFIVSLRTPGLEIVPIRLVSGQTGFCQEFFDDVRVPRDSVLGDVNDGWNVASRLLVHERNVLNGGSEYWLPPGGFGPRAGAETVRRRDDLVEEAVSRGDEKDAYVRQLVAEAYINAKVGAQLGPRITAAMRKGLMAPAASSILKLMNSENGIRRSDITAVLAGSSMAAWTPGDISAAGRGLGYLARQAGALVSGTSEIQRNIISERVLDLPREAAPDRVLPFKEVRHNSMPSRRR